MVVPAPGLVEGFSAKLGWSICARNVIVEGTSDVALFNLAGRLYRERHNVAIVGGEISILHAGYGDEGGVDGLNRRLNAARQLADADRSLDGSLKYRFIGLFDNDNAGRQAVSNACDFDRRLRRCGDLFLLNPVMPLAQGADYRVLQQRFETHNAAFKGLDCEVEDLLSERLLSAFEDECPNAVVDDFERAGFKHREFTKDGKRQLQQFVTKHAKFDDLIEIVKLIRALRDYLRLQIDHIQC